MRTKIIAIGIIAMIALCTTMAMAIPNNGRASISAAVPFEFVDMTPDTLNLNSNGNYITAFINYAEDVDPAGVDINPAQFTLIYEEHVLTAVYVCDDTDTADLAVRFDRVTVLGWLGAGDEDPATPIETLIEMSVEYTAVEIGSDIFAVLQSKNNQGNK